ncbi:hypothetical protein BT93_J1130 [Corymbia citriodora subsp. variegata]|nr:hypothetical protein BT93_J1130 [Corymbia citriodora subsp. variegata]
MFSLPPPPDLKENPIVPVDESHDEQHQGEKPSVYRVPPYITKLNGEAYQPQVVSFGPYHHGKDHLRPMEEHKHRARVHFLELSRKSPTTFLDSLRKVEDEVKDSYDVLDPEWKIMRAATKEKNGYAPNKPFFNMPRQKFIEPYISQDMLLLENQLPMQVLYQLVAVMNNGREDDVNQLIGKFYFPGENKKFTGLGKCLHVMDVFRRGLLMEPWKVQHDLEIGLEAINEISGSAPKETEPIIRSATELQEAGIRFKPSKACLKDIHFDRGVLELPFFTVDDTTKSRLLNAMTFERLHSEVGNEVTSYVIFMDKIINNEQDVALLHTEGIIQNDLGSDKEVAQLFNSLCTDVTLPFDNNIDTVQKKISDHCKNNWNKCRAYFNRTYFKNPWTILSLFAAIFLFMLTILQTIYIVLTYY